MVELNQVSFFYSSEGEEVLSRGRNEKDMAGGLAEVSLTIKRGEFILLTGPSGCGKTTILRLINGLIPNYYTGKLVGNISVDGESIEGKELFELSKKVGTVFQNPRSQFFNVDTTSELAFACENQSMPEEQIKIRIEDTVERFQVASLMGKSIFKLSGGEKQKIACASIDVGRPEIILLDEPSANLDYEATMQLRKLIQIWKKQGKTILAAEHRISYLWDMIDRAIIMRDGKLIEALEGEQRNHLSSLQTADMGLRSTILEDPINISLPAIEPGDRIITLNDFRFSYRKGLFEKSSSKNNILDMDELHIAEGKITAITGPNGCGKTTFLKCLCGLEKRCQGTMKYQGKIYDRRKRRELLFMVMQDANHQLFAESVLEEVLISIPDAAADQQRKQAETILEKVDLLQFQDRHPMSLSGGQKQRLAIACAISSGRKILLFDEPTSGLDYIHMVQTAELMKELKSLGMTLIIVTHDSELIRNCCERKIILHTRKVR